MSTALNPCGHATSRLCLMSHWCFFVVTGFVYTIPKFIVLSEHSSSPPRDKNEDVVLEACEFWFTFADSEHLDLTQYIHLLLAKVAPVLLDCMPRHYGSKLHGFQCEVNSDKASGAKRGPYGEALGDEDDDDYDELGDNDFAKEMSTEWNLRKCAAAALTADLLNSDEWLQRESSILALGAMAEGYIDTIEPHLPTLVSYLINTLNDPKPLCTQPISDKHKNQFFVPTLEGLLRMVLDNNKRVQEAGCSAFATLEEDAGPELAPYLEPVLRNLVFAFEKYQHKNMLILYDAVGTLANAVGTALQNPTYVEILMPPLLKRWSKLKDDDEDLVPLLECLASVTIAIGPAFLPYAGPIFDRCQTIVHTSLLQYQTYQQNPEMDEPDRSFLVVALDLLSGLTQGLGMALEPHISRSQRNLLSLLTVC
ncbi:armadillo-type protein [Cerioporus squamosus]|nr:armadillo-type protein [Cerioporus squamosus]